MLQCQPSVYVLLLQPYMINKSSTAPSIAKTKGTRKPMLVDVPMVVVSQHETDSKTIFNAQRPA